MTSETPPLRCLWHELPHGPFCYELATVAFVEPGTSRTFAGACTAHADPAYWAQRVTVPHELIELAEWRRRGSGFRGREGGGAAG